jgi:hypothetical protein
MEPATQGGRSGEAIGIFDHRRRLLPGTTLHKAASQRLAAGDQAVMAVGWRELGQEREGLVARPAPAASNRNPVVVLVVSLFATAAMADNRIKLTTWAAPQDGLTGDYGPITFKLGLLGGKWDKTNRSNGSCRDRSRLEPKGSLPSSGKSSPEKE